MKKYSCFSNKKIKGNIEGLASQRIGFSDEVILIDDRKHNRLGIYQYSNDPLMAKENGTVLVIQYEADYDRWKTLQEDSYAYKAEKKRILDDTIKGLEEHFPGLAALVEASDVATPISCERYTGNWRGATQGWLMTTESMTKLFSGFRLPKAFNTVDNFYMIGQWTEIGGGLPPTIRTGRDLVRMIIKSERGNRKY